MEIFVDKILIGESKLSGMKKFTIAEVEQLTGIRANTLRIWERRYPVQKPHRDRYNFRYYFLSDLRSLLYISLLSRNGFKISYLSSLSQDELHSKAKSLGNEDDRHFLAFIDLLVTMYTLNTDQFEAVLNECFKSWPAPTVFQQIVFPFLRKIGVFWEGNRLTEEHLVVTIIRKKLNYYIESLSFIPVHDHKKALLFLPDKKQIDLPLLYAFYCIKMHGIHVIYMGNDVTIENVLTVLRVIKPHYLFTYDCRKTRFQFNDLAFAMKEILPHSRLVITSQSDTEPPRFSSANIVSLNFDEAIHFLCP